MFKKNDIKTDFRFLAGNERNMIIYSRNAKNIRGSGSAAVGGQKNAFGVTLGAVSGTWADLTTWMSGWT